MSAASAPEAPFDEPWQARAFALGEALVERVGDRRPLQQHLASAIASGGDRPYWESYVEAVAALAHELGIEEHR